MKNKFHQQVLGYFKLRKKEKCFGCRQLVDAAKLTQFVGNDPECKFCPTCAFVMGLYIQKGLRTQFSEGSLHLDVINNEFRKAAKEFLCNPRETEQKYLQPLMEKSSRSKIQITDKKIRIFDLFPFIFLTPEQYEYHRPQPGREFVLYGKTLELHRRLYVIVRMSAEHCEKYGRHGDHYICYFPEKYED